MNRIVKTNYPVDKLPEDLRPDLPAGSEVTVTVDVEITAKLDDGLEPPPGPRMTIDEILSAVPESQRRSGKEIDAALRAERRGWRR